MTGSKRHLGKPVRVAVAIYRPGLSAVNFTHRITSPTDFRRSCRRTLAITDVIEDGIARITLEDAQRLSRYLVRQGDIVYSRRGDVERRALIRAREDGWLCGTGCLRVRFGNKGVNPVYASY